MSKFIIEGVDRLGKTTLLNSIHEKYGYFLNIKYDKPPDINFYKNVQTYQKELYKTMFELISRTDVGMIFDRAHLSEYVYGKLYRDYEADYVFELEQEAYIKNTRLILLVTSNMSLGEDDGESHDWARRQEEQDLFIEAFGKSCIKDKRIIDVHDGKGQYKTPQALLSEVMLY